MTPQRLKRFRELFREQRERMLHAKSVVDRDFEIARDDLPDETDMTASELEQSMRLRLRHREALFLRKLDEALRRIAEGSFGECRGCGDDIDEKRLEARPTAALCVNCKEEEERAELLHIDGLRPKSVGSRMRPF